MTEHARVLFPPPPLSEATSSQEEVAAGPQSAQVIATTATTSAFSFRDSYAVHEQLGKGAFSTVYRCSHRATSEVFAVKVVDLRPLRLRPGFDAKR